MSEAKNVLNQPLQVCCTDPMTGFYRSGYCETGPGDVGIHVVCAKMTEEFLEFTRQQGNDLSTPVPAYRFPGLKPGDRWCLCASRWKEALEANVAPPVILSATHLNTLAIVPLEILEKYAIHPEA
ncbi:DUF2237 family protein [Roseofilum casamattae]|uniref:DUF2237 domain-containing protein n=1 Tax=Roseofilum casamattae BLCC-M143 TaxID=3022442 RepID=A0ABT7BZ37_9CYAN|nr:DUF2237 domain-containing protein [Roseofilum casamattae]MDJ1183711.1 DUF2237 domain-containing protein [Roseofilum casamattae BLCC-M143]